MIIKLLRFFARIALRLQPTKVAIVYVTRDTDGAYALFTRSKPEPIRVQKHDKEHLIFTGSGREPLSSDAITDLVGQLRPGQALHFLSKRMQEAKTPLAKKLSQEMLSQCAHLTFEVCRTLEKMNVLKFDDVVAVGSKMATDMDTATSIFQSLSKLGAPTSISPDQHDNN